MPSTVRVARATSANSNEAGRNGDGNDRECHMNGDSIGRWPWCVHENFMHVRPGVPRASSHSEDDGQTQTNAEDEIVAETLALARNGAHDEVSTPSSMAVRTVSVAKTVDMSDGVDEQSEQSFPASDPPSWSGLSL